MMVLRFNLPKLQMGSTNLVAKVKLSSFHPKSFVFGSFNTEFFPHSSVDLPQPHVRRGPSN